VTILNKPAVRGPVQVEFVEIKSVVTAHARSVLSDETTEIESTDAATIERWFAETFKYQVPVPDLSKAGILLSGGRVDYLQDRPVPTVALSRGGHPISLYIIRSDDTDAFAVRGNRNGYNVVGWASADFAYLAASNIDRDVLDALQDCFADLTTPEASLPAREPAP
jgi:anti-sigma factor RsiW